MTFIVQSYFDTPSRYVLSVKFCGAVVLKAMDQKTLYANIRHSVQENRLQMLVVNVNIPQKIPLWHDCVTSTDHIDACAYKMPFCSLGGSSAIHTRIKIKSNKIN